MRVFLVDDDLTMRQAMARLLRVGGFQVVGQAGNGDEALRLLEQLHIDLLITDWQMPRMDGLELITALRSRGDQTPILMISSQCDRRLIARARSAGASGYLIKPIESSSFFNAIDEVLAPSAAV